MKWFLNVMMILSLFLTVEAANARVAHQAGKAVGKSVKMVKSGHKKAVGFGKKQNANRLERKEKRKLKKEERKAKKGERKANRKNKRVQRKADFKAGYQDGLE